MKHGLGVLLTAASHSGKAAAVMTGYEGRREGSPEDDQDKDKPHVATDTRMPGGMYRNTFWVPRPAGSAVLVGLGIHGQMVYVNTAANVVGVSCRTGL